MNPVYKLEQSKFCSSVVDADLVKTIIEEREAAKVVTVDTELETDLIINNESKKAIGKFKNTFYSNGTEKMELQLSKSFIEAFASSGN